MGVQGRRAWPTAETAGLTTNPLASVAACSASSLRWATASSLTG